MGTDLAAGDAVTGNGPGCTTTITFNDIVATGDSTPVGVDSDGIFIGAFGFDTEAALSFSVIFSESMILTEFGIGWSEDDAATFLFTKDGTGISTAQNVFDNGENNNNRDVALPFDMGNLPVFEASVKYIFSLPNGSSDGLGNSPIFEGNNCQLKSVSVS